ncbi:restriction endonuclease subunit S [Streptococcus uberis]|uniref:restriction endonuclease subunit S n=1 Tax=Streptococcus uberis TaxID=1349 RepID=UPI0012B59987|nr:restriction endonuclease subunit S [Streptococcus uberis]MTB56433.1 restriction endonuclease subunit S [Streptococcus uberis]MTB98311.1 restriction endonuclease subunit S [Streptococcus uberis]
MNKIETLIKELCPNGVEWKELGNICTVKTGKGINKNFIQANPGEFPVVNSGKDPLGFVNIFNTVDDPIGITSRGAGVGYVSWNEGNYFRGNLNYSATIKDKSKLSARFLYFYLKNNSVEIEKLCTFNGIPALNKENLEKLTIPIPPLEIQEEIVKILDKFTDYVTELTTELTLRQKQYNYYRDKLLSFENEVQIKKLSELATIKARIGWQGLTKKEYLKTGKYYLVTGTDFIKGTVNFSTCHFVEEERYLQDINIQLKNEDVLVTKDGTLGKVAYITNLPGPTTLNSGVFVVRKNSDEILSRYLYHYLNSPYLMKFAQSRLTGGTIKHLNQNVIVDFPIPIPDLEKQKEIIYILDSFNSIVNSLEKGLPKEIELRQKQYEYYRDKLLTFD